MAALHGELVAAIEAGETLVCESPQRAAALRAAWADHQLARGLTVWSTPDILPFDAWAERVLDRLRDAGHPLPRLLSPVEQVLLWREVAQTLVQRRDLPLLGAARLADALRTALRIMQEYLIPTRRLARAGTAEADWLVACQQELARRSDRLAARLSWMDADPGAMQIESDVAPVRLAGFGMRLTPARQQFLDAFAASGGRWSRCETAVEAVAPRTCLTTDPDEELRQIARWCRMRLAAQPAARLLVVITDLDARRALVERALLEELDPDAAWEARSASTRFSIEGGAPLADAPLIARALRALEVLLRPLERDDWLRWLACWDAGDGSDPVRERLLRAARQWQGPALRLGALLLRAGLDADDKDGWPAWLRDYQQAAIDFDDSRQPTHEWARRFAAALARIRLDSDAPADSPTQQLRERWNTLLEDYAAAHEFVGKVDASAALGQLRALAQRTRFAPAAGSAAVTVSPSLADPVVRYDAIWVAGLTSEQFPAPPRIDPYVPWALQVEYGVAAASPARCLELARERLGAWRRGAGELVLSHAAESQAAEQAPSPLVAEWFADAATRLETLPAATTAQRLADAERALDRYSDDRGERWPAAQVLRGGSGTIARSNDCAFLGYAELRLAAREPDAAAAGLPASTRGVLLHRALQLLWQGWRSQARLLALDPAARRSDIERALGEVIDAESARERDPMLLRALRRERRRAAALIAALVDGEAQRPPFEVAGCEQTIEVLLDGARLVLRIDRIDAIQVDAPGPTSQLAIFDYKTGRSVADDWISDRPDTMQWLVYAAAVAAAGLGAPVALCAVRLTEGRVGYDGVAAQPESLAPLLKAQRRQLDWEPQLQRWREQVADRIGRVLAGEARLDPRPDACRNCALPLLCRRAELLDGAAEPAP